MLKHIAALSLIVTCVGVIFIMQARHHHVVLKRGAIIGPNETTRKFAKLRFTPVTDSNFWQLVESETFQHIASNTCPSTQVQKLLPQIKQSIKCYAGMADFDSYLGFKSAGCPFTVSLEDIVVGETLHKMALDGVALPAKDIDKARAVWDLLTERKRTNGNGGIAEIGLERLTVVIRRSHTGQSPLFEIAMRDTGAGGQGISPSLIKAEDTPDKILKREGDVWYAIVGLPCLIGNERNASEAHYLHLSFYWSGMASRWIPDHLADDYPLKFPGKPPIVFPESFAYPTYF